MGGYHNSYVHGRPPVTNHIKRNVTAAVTDQRTKARIYCTRYKELLSLSSVRGAKGEIEALKYTMLAFQGVLVASSITRICRKKARNQINIK
jgi:hypothetical protein